MQIDRRIIESSLRKKGFIEEEGGGHKYFHHKVGDKRTGPYTFLSRGSKYKTYDVSLLKFMKKHLRLDSLDQVKRLLECPMTGEEYNSILKSKGVF